VARYRTKNSSEYLRKRILEVLTLDKALGYAVIAERFGVSVDTVRRLAKMYHLERTVQCARH
jgi:transposase